MSTIASFAVPSRNFKALAPVGAATKKAHPLRLVYLRRAFVGVLLAALVFAGCFMVFGSSATLTNAQAQVGAVQSHDGALLGTAPGVRVITVAPGDSVWSIAAGLAGDADPRPLVREIMLLNDMTASDLVVGRELQVPVR